MFPKEGEYFCKSCYGVLFSPKCPGCNDPIVEGSVLTIQNRKWHANCFVCDYCEGALNGLQYDVKWFIHANCFVCDYCEGALNGL